MNKSIEENKKYVFLGAFVYQEFNECLMFLSKEEGRDYIDF